MSLGGDENIPVKTENSPTVHLKVDLDGVSPFTGRSTENGVPVCLPLKNLEELFAWQANDATDHGQPFTVSSLPRREKVNDDSAKVLLCHDMSGNYLDDRFAQQIVGKRTLEYQLSYWSLVDTFVYFSHHFITIPPVGWINACHTNGVSTLGTFITEFTDGYHRCRAIFSTEGVWKLVADQLVSISTFYGFDGWLINIENKIEIEMIPALIQFVSYLREKMHAVDVNAQVIWYDSVTREGTLKWQNELDKENKDFYNACDGIFLNYAWSASSLERSLSLVKGINTVYVGVDVFGRGVLGGGGFNSCEALAIIARFGFSVALFAPGWVLEVLGKSGFQANNKSFWKLLSPYIHPRSIKCPNGFSTSFHPGIPDNENKGPLQCELSLQSLMPCLPSDGLSLSITPKGHYLQLKSGLHAVFPVFKFHTDVAKGVLTLKILSNREIWETELLLFTDKGNVPLLTSTHGNFHVKMTTKKRNRTVLITVEIHAAEGFVVQGMNWKPHHDITIYSVSLYPDLSADAHTVGKIDILCDDISWKRDESDRFFLLDCTLVFTKSTVSGMFKSEIACTPNLGLCGAVHRPMRSVLGWSRCSKFRVHELKVANPKFGGPLCDALFEVCHLDDAGNKLAEGKLLITYSE